MRCPAHAFLDGMQYACNASLSLAGHLGAKVILTGSGGIGKSVGLLYVLWKISQDRPEAVVILTAEADPWLVRFSKYVSGLSGLSCCLAVLILSQMRYFMCNELPLPPRQCLPNIALIEIWYSLHTRILSLHSSRVKHCAWQPSCSSAPLTFVCIKFQCSSSL